MLLNIAKRDKIRNEVIRSQTGVEDIIERMQCMQGHWICSQNEQNQVGRDNIRMDTQRRKTSKRKTQKEMERQHQGSCEQSMDESSSRSMVQIVEAICKQ